MHRAGAVAFAVARSRVHGVLVALLTVAGLAVLLAWLLSRSSGLSWGLLVPAGLVVLALDALAWRDWRKTPVAVLHWDGHHWYWEPWGELPLRQVHVVADGQWWVLVALSGPGRRRAHRFVERSHDPWHWEPLRRALFDRGAAGDALPVTP